MGGGWDGQPGWYFVNHAPGQVPQTSQTIDGLVPGATYRVSGYFAPHTNNTPGTDLRILIDNVVMFADPPVPVGVWTPFTFTFVATDGDAVLTFRSQVNGDDAHGIDHISVVRE